MFEIQMTGTMTSMTSREIAELTGKEHRHVMRDIRTMLSQMHGGHPDDYSTEKLVENQKSPSLVSGVCVAAYGVNSAGLQVFEYLLDRENSYCLVTGYDAAARMRIIKRWQELEAKQSRQMSPAEVLIFQGQMMLVIENEQKRQAEQQALLSSRQDVVEKRLDSIQGAAENSTIVGWHNIRKIKGGVSQKVAAKMGTLAANYCRANGIETGKVPDGVWGTVNTYPNHVLDLLFLGSRRDAEK